MRAEPLSGIQPALLRWARESANMTTADVAEKLKRSVADIDAWENGDGAPSYSQLEKLAYDLYKRPLAIFFLPAPPDEPKAKAEFRSLPEHDLSTLAPDTMLLIRKTRAFQFALDEVFGGRNPAERPLWRTIRLSSSRPVTAQAAKVREELGVSLEQQALWKDDDDALKQWRRAIEARGIFVFKNTFKQREISGFCLNSPEFPTIMVNNSTTRTRQIFSLLHELAHILFSRSGISTFDERRIESLPPQDRNVERFCNAVAAEILVPLADFKAQTEPLTIDPENATDDFFASLARRYHVSRAVLLRRFLDENRVSTTFYDLKTREWDAQKSKAGSGGNHHATQKNLSERALLARGIQSVFAAANEPRRSCGFNWCQTQKLGWSGRPRAARCRCMIYVFDTNSFSELNAYYPDIFRAFWQRFDHMVAAGEVVSTREVYPELINGGKEHILKWAKANKDVFTTPSSIETAFVGKIFSVRHFQALIDQKSQLRGTPVADPFVIACAHAHKGTVVTQEKLKPNAAKIPNVCDHFKVPCIDL